jgi:hypothetical protein
VRASEANVVAGIWYLAGEAIGHRAWRSFMLALLCIFSAPCLPESRQALADMANTPVRQRIHDHLEPSGIFWAGMLIYPSVTAAMAYDSNIFASPDLPADDFALILAPNLRIQKNDDTSINELELNARHYEYERFDSENRTEAQAALKLGRERAGGLRFDTSIAALSTFEPRGDSLTATKSTIPIAYRDLRAETTITKSFNRLGIALSGGVRSLTFDDGETSTGAAIDQSFRNGTIVSAGLMPFYDFSPGYRAYTRLQVNQRDYEGTDALDRDSQGFDARGGVEFLITPMLFGSVGVGYFEQQYDNPQIPPANGLSINADLTWLMTPLMTVTLMSSRTVAELAAPGQNARIDFTTGIKLDYEIRRNLIATFGAKYKNETFTGLSRSDNIFNLITGIDYSLNSYLIFGLNYVYLDRQSEIADFDFDRHRLMINVTARY